MWLLTPGRLEKGSPYPSFPSWCSPGEPTASIPPLNGPEWMDHEWVFGVTRLPAHSSPCCPESHSTVLSYLDIFILNTRCVLEIVQKKALEKEVLPETKAAISKTHLFIIPCLINFSMNPSPREQASALNSNCRLSPPLLPGSKAGP